MKIGVISDTHDNLPNIRRALEIFRNEGVEAIIHAGDIVAPFSVRELLKFQGPVYGVFGNNDGERVGIRNIWEKVYDPPHALTLGGRRIVVMHDLIAPEQLPADMRSAEIFIHGHSHRASVVHDPGKPLILNPGECGGWLTGIASVAVLDAETLEVKLINI